MDESIRNSVEPFQVFDCSLIRCATGRVCSNLRELLEALRSASDAVIEHHLMRCVLEDHFELHEFPNDLARWCWAGLGDQMLGEQLGLVDPYHHATLADLRATLLNMVEDRLWGKEQVPACRPGLELHLVESRLIAYDTGERISSLAALLEALVRMPLRSLFFHVHEARRRTAGQGDDFSLWLRQYGAEPSLLEQLQKVDFYFLNLSQLRDTLVDILRHHASEAPPIPRTIA
jgi:hypothetical protein